MLELATLGLLQGESLHGYRLKQKLELFMSGCISVNYGSIYPLLRRLEQKGLIYIVKEKEGKKGSLRKIYNITDKGRERWKEKMMEHPHESWVHARSRFMIKFFFFSYLEPEERIKLLENRIIKCHLRLEDRELKELPTDSYQSSAWERCCSVIQDEINWLNRQIKLEGKLISR